MRAARLLRFPSIAIARAMRSANQWVPKMLAGEKPVDFKGENQRFIGTHNGKFHCDEVFACWMLKTLPEFDSRNPEVLEKCEIVVDVGAKFDPKTKRFDHHQKEFEETMQTLSVQQKEGRLKCGDGLAYDTRLSSAGLIYAFYGKQMLRRVLENNGAHRLKDENVDFYFDRMYRNFVEAVDAVDNGIKQHEGQPRYLTPVSLQSLVEELNPAWNDKQSDPDVQFEKAMGVVGDIFTRHLLYMHKSWMPCRNIVEEAIMDREKTHPSGKILVLKESCPWKQHFFMLEKDWAIQNELIYALYPGNDEKTDWRVQAIPVSETSDFDNRCPLPADWRGVRDDKLAALIGIPTASFVHQSGFIGGAKTCEDALQMAVKSLEIHGLLK
ncbi:hypothetical protein M3Y99_00639700 [Aphelenchoides fujianensis]|nr:hypothetical protein M3Y99_00639700 [Aphelenchoides fujianensis]